MPDHPPSDPSPLKGQLLAFVSRRVRGASDAEDVVQETMARAVAAQHAEAIGNMRAYLYKIAGNLSVDALRHRNVRERISGASLDSPEALSVHSPEPSAEQVLLARERKAAFEAALAGLPERQRQALVLNRIEGWPYPRIARHLGCSPNTVYNDIKAAMAHIIAHTSGLEL